MYMSVVEIANAISGEDESSSKLSSSVVDSSNSSRDSSSLIDSKLGDRNMSSSESSTPVKRARISGSNSQLVYCQVYGCNKDLSSSREYHKRHKVCEVHSKTARAIVNGIEQRFCQQCSRFHLLAEFDDGKRSCRNRLAGHNERRRKPQLTATHSAMAGRLLQSRNGEGGTNSWCKPIKAASIPITTGHLLAKPVNPPDDLDHMFQDIHTISFPDTTSTVDRLSGISDSGCAFSLLSSQSQNSSSNSSGNIPVSRLLALSSNCSLSSSNGESLSGPNFGTSDEVYKGSGLMKAETNHSCEDGSCMMDLFQLTSQLQRVEQQRQPMRIQEKGCFDKADSLLNQPDRS